MSSNPTNLDNRNLKAHMWPDGNLSNPSSLPDIYDNSGQIVTNDTRILSNSSAIDIGDSPNSNTGDPLRLAFIKVNNFMEAMYWTNSAIDSDITEIKTDVNNFTLGLDSKLDSEYARVNAVIKALDMELDSEYTARIANQVVQQMSLDSDSIVIQAIQSFGYIASSTAPASPTNGRLWFDTTNDTFNLYSSAAGGWLNVGSVTNTSGSFLFSTDGGSF